jgi:aryl-alcohol dehydrogenase-like predicted oxidoreductase
MERRRLGNTGMSVSALGLGAATIGFDNVELGVVQELLKEAQEVGVNLIDTAECYGSSEDLLGQAMGGFQEPFLVVTKCGHPDGGWKEDYSPDSLQLSIERSLRRLRRQHLDAVLLHSCSVEVLKRGDAIAALQRARQAGQARFIGYSGDGPAAVWAVQSGCFDLLEISVNVADQESVDTVIPRAVAAGMGVIAKRPLANGMWQSPTPPENAYHRPYWERLQKLDYPLLRNPSEAAAIALRFTLTVPGVATAIVGTKQPGRLRQNASLVARGPLPAPEFEEIRRQWQERSGGRWSGEI